MPTETNYHTVRGRIIGQSVGGIQTDYLTDALGSVSATVNSSQAVMNTYRAKPYGQSLARTGSGIDPKFLWTGDTGSRRTGLSGADQYNRARHYGSRQAQWTTLDPLWPGEWPYSYAALSPVVRIDHWGNSSVKCGDCCSGADKWFEDRSDHCKEGKWTKCPDPNQVAAECAKLGQASCLALKKAIQEIGELCSKMCAGGGYGKGEQWDAAAYCCVDDGKSKGCEVRCCSNTADTWRGNPLKACIMKCLLLHENNHLIECNKYPPGPKDEPPYSECCAYYSQLVCLARTFTALCPGDEMPQSFLNCIRKAEKFKCSQRYA